MAAGFLGTICFDLKIGDIVLASDGKGCYHVAEITGDYFFVENASLPHRRSVKWLGVVIPRRAMSPALQNSSGSIGTCCNITKYAKELESLINGTPIPDDSQNGHTGNFKERNLHPLLANYLLDKNIFSKTIFHETSNNSDQAQKWVHPDMVGVLFNDFRNPATQKLLKTAQTKEYIELYSYELKRSIDNDHQLKEYFFQALSNSSWANYGYLVTFDFKEEIMEEMRRLNRAFGIGIIKLSPYKNETYCVFEARKRNLDYYTIDKLCQINENFKEFIIKTTKVLIAQNDYIEDVKSGLQKICDKGFNSDEEILEYCKKNHIPC